MPKRETVVDPWIKICQEAGLRDPFPFVSPLIPREVIGKHAPGHQPQRIIPIYSREASQRQFPFLFHNHLTPIRVDIGTAVLTRADLFQDLERIHNDTIFVERQKKMMVSSLQTEVGTEARYLALALHHGVFQIAFGIAPDTHLSLGLFGKMNLPRTRIFVSDFEDNGMMYPIDLLNVQFELDLSLEDEQYAYIIEAKLGKPKARSFNVLQLFYPYVALHDAAKKCGKEIRMFFVNIFKNEDLSIGYEFHEYSFSTSLVVNSIKFQREIRANLEGESYTRLDSSII